MRGPADVERLVALLDASGGGALQIVAIVTETARGLQCLSHFRDPMPRVAGLMWGAEDLSADLQGTTNRDGATGEYLGPYRIARDACLIAARAIGTSAIDAGYPDFRDLDGLRRESLAHRAHRLRREDRDPSGPARGDRRGVLADRGRPARGPSASSPRSAATRRSPQLDGVMLDVPHLRRARAILGT